MCERNKNVKLKQFILVEIIEMAEKFETVEWAATANIYEVNVRQYSPEGTLSAFEKALPRLRNMEIDILWFMPLTPVSWQQRQGSLGSYYACSDYTSVSSEYGTVDDFKKVVRKAHDLGFKVLIDWVANHTGYDHVWTRQHPDFYKRNDQGNFYEAHGWVDVIDLDYNNSTLRETMIDAMSYWVNECDIDGFRCDMAHLVPLDFWEQARTVLDQKKKLFWLAECEVLAYHQVFDATYGWELLHTMEAVSRNQASISNLKDVLEKYGREFPASALRLLFTSNHDENSHSGSEYERFGGAAKAFAVLCATWRNSLPLVYSGQEMPNTKRLKFFDKDEIEWTGQYLNESFYKTLLGLRKRCVALRAGDIEGTTTIINTNASDNIFAFIRKLGENEVLVLLNLSSGSLLVTVNDSLTGKFTNAFSEGEIEINEMSKLEMQGWEYLVYIKNEAG